MTTRDPLPDAALESLFRAHVRQVLAFLQGVLGVDDGARTRELLLETFLRAAERPRPRWREPLPWLLGIAHGVAEEHAKPEPGQGEPGDLRQALAGLPLPERAAFVLAHDLGLTPAHVATALGCTPAQARARLRAAARHLGRAARVGGVIS